MKKNNTKEKQILIVGENPRTLTDLKKLSFHNGLSYRFEKVDTFAQAVDAMFSGKYDLVVLDYPNIRGPYLLNLAFLRAIPVILSVSSPLLPLERQYLREKGIAGILLKENPAEIIKILESIFSSKQETNSQDNMGSSLIP